MPRRPALPSGRIPPLPARRWLASGLLLVLALAPGCGAMAPSRRMNEARNRIQGLQSENQQLRDVALGLRSQNRDLAQRAVEDARRLRAQDEAIDRYERSIAQYQQDRDQVAAQLDNLRGAVRTAALEPPTTAMRGRLESYAREHATARLDGARGTLRFAAASLFRPGSAELTADGLTALDDLASSLGAEPDGLALKVIGLGSGQELAATGAGEPAALGLARARAVRDRLAARASIPPALVTVSADATAPVGTTSGAAPSDPALIRTGGGGGGSDGVEIQVLRRADPGAGP